MGRFYSGPKNVGVPTNDAWQDLLRHILADGEERAPRGILTKELVAYTSVVPMSNPVVTLAARKMGYRFLAAESAWILSGDNRVSSIAPYSKDISRFSDDGLVFFGGYGPRFVDQVRHVTAAIIADQDTRQAVVTFWRPNPPGTKDVPCTVALQWLLRDGRLDCVATMRSSDAWLGWVYDVHAFSMMSARVVLGIRHAIRREELADNGTSRQRWQDEMSETKLGSLYLTAGSQHLYARDIGKAYECIKGHDTDATIADLDLNQFDHPDELTRHLWNVAQRIDPGTGAWNPRHQWLAETLR